MEPWMHETMLQAYDRYTGWMLPEYDLGNMGNATYEEIANFLEEELKQLNEEYKGFINKSKEPNDIWDRQAKRIKKVIDAHAKFGYDTINYRGKYPYLKDLHEELKERFNNQYGRMVIVYNTAKEFNLQLQTIFDNIAPNYENELAIQSAYYKEYYDTKKENSDGTPNPNYMRLKDDINFDDFSRNDTFAYPAETKAKHISTSENTTYGTKNKIGTMVLMARLPQGFLKSYLNEFYSLFETIWYDNGGHQII